MDIRMQVPVPSFCYTVLFIASAIVNEAPLGFEADDGLVGDGRQFTWILTRVHNTW